MSEHKVDVTTISKMIPQIFDQMRSQTTSTNFVSTTASLSTQSLLKEQEELDKIIPVIQNLNAKIKECKEGDMERIKETCRAMNIILDKFINIQSQASYVNKLMRNEEYLDYVASGKSEEEYLLEKQKELDELDKKVKQASAMHAPTMQPPSSSIPRVSDSRRVNKPVLRNGRSGLFSQNSRRGGSGPSATTGGNTVRRKVSRP